MGSRTRSLQLKVMYCKDLRAFNFFQKLSVYAVVSILSDEEKLELLPQQRQRQKTPTDTEGDGNPEWNHEMRFDLGLGGHDDDDHLFLHFDLRYDLAVFGDKSLGEVRVLLKDLINVGESIVRFVNYEVRNSDGKPNGVLNFSYKVLNDAYNGGGGDGDGDSPMKNNINAHIPGYPIVNPINNHHQISDDDQSHKPFAADVNCSSLFPSSQVHYASPPPEEYLQIPSAQSQESYYPAVAAAPHHQVHYPSLETPYSTLAEVGYTDYPLHQYINFIICHRLPHHHGLLLLLLIILLIIIMGGKERFITHPHLGYMNILTLGHPILWAVIMLTSLTVCIAHTTQGGIDRTIVGQLGAFLEHAWIENAADCQSFEEEYYRGQNDNDDDGGDDAGVVLV